LRESVDYKVLGRYKTENFQLQKNAYIQGVQSRTHSHHNSRFVFVLRGRFSEVYGQKKRECVPLTTIFRPAGEKHSESYYGKGIVCLRVDLAPNWLKRVCRYPIEVSHSADFHNDELIAIIHKLNAEFDKFDDLSELAIEALMLETIVSISRRKKISASNNKSPRWLTHAKDYIHAEFDSNLTISGIAASAGIHPAHLARVFRYTHKCTIAEYIRRLRIEFACAALRSSNESLAEIALNSGFSDQSRFSKTFKRLMNQTPAEYRVANLSR